MRESIGAAWIMVIVMTFITVFSGYLAFSVNYSKAFRVKDGIVERIQKHNGIVDAKGTLVEIDNFLKEINYNAKGNCNQFLKEKDDETGESYVNGTNLAGITGTEARINPRDDEVFNYCLVKVAANRSTSTAMNAAYYKVFVFFSLQIGSITLFSKFNVQGQTQTIYYGQDAIFG